MLIVRQDGKVVMNLDSISCIEIDPLCPICLTAVVPRQFEKGLHYEHECDESFHRFYLGTFMCNAHAKKVLNDLVTAYENHKKVFRIPKQECEQKC